MGNITGTVDLPIILCAGRFDYLPIPYPDHARDGGAGVADKRAGPDPFSTPRRAIDISVCSCASSGKTCKLIKPAGNYSTIAMQQLGRL